MFLLGLLNKHNSFKGFTLWLRQYSEEIYILKSIHPVNRKMFNFQIETGKEKQENKKEKPK